MITPSSAVERFKNMEIAAGEMENIARQVGVDSRTLRSIRSGKRATNELTGMKLVAYFKKIDRKAKL